MEKEKYNIKLKALEQLHKNQVALLKRDYALSNNSISVGDIIQDHYHKIKVDSIKVGQSLSEYPECVYYGADLKKDNTPKKSGERSDMWQSNVIK